MREGEDDVLLFGQQRFEGLGFLQVQGQRLVANDVDAGVYEGLGRRHVHVVGRDDGHRLDAVGAFRFCFRHLLERTVAA